MKKAYVFIDKENFRRKIQRFGSPPDFNYTKISAFFSKQKNLPQMHIKKVYVYDVDPNNISIAARKYFDQIGQKNKKELLLNFQSTIKKQGCIIRSSYCYLGWEEKNGFDPVTKTSKKFECIVEKGIEVLLCSDLSYFANDLNLIFQNTILMQELELTQQDIQEGCDIVIVCSEDRDLCPIMKRLMVLNKVLVVNCFPLKPTGSELSKKNIYCHEFVRIDRTNPFPLYQKNTLNPDK